MQPAAKVTVLATEWSELKLGDPRLDARVRRVATLIESSPAASLPKQMGTEADLEAAYRLFAHDEVTFDRLLSPHVAKTHERCARHQTVRVAHDTTTLRFEGDREGLGSIGGDARGFFLHAALAVGGDELREPLGVLGARTHINTKIWPTRQKTKVERVAECVAKPRDEKHSSRWEKLALAVNRELPEHIRAIHVMDQEADDYVLIAELIATNCAFVIRGSGERRLRPEGATVREAISEVPATIFRTVPLNPRTPKQVKRSKTRRPVRNERDATLSIRAGTVEIFRQSKTQSDAKSIKVNAVQVFEATPPVGEEAIEWILLTSEPIDTLEQAAAVVDHYRARWVVEELFKALKTGCSFEKRQLTAYDSLLSALGLFLPTAWHLLALRHLARMAPERPASALFTAQQLLILGAMAARLRHKLPATPSVRDAMLAIARLGGHITNNGDPGWIVLGRGFEEFARAEEVWNLAQPRDQS